MTANGANKKLVLHVQLRCGLLSITSQVSHLANEFDQGVHGQGKSQGKTNFFKVRELSGNFEIGKGNLKMKQKVREKSGNFEIASF